MTGWLKQPKLRHWLSGEDNPLGVTVASKISVRNKEKSIQSIDMYD